MYGKEKRPQGPRMSLQPGTKLGPYEILSPIGVGDAIELYKASDERLSRTS